MSYRYNVHIFLCYIYFLPFSISSELFSFLPFLFYYFAQTHFQLSFSISYVSTGRSWHSWAFRSMMHNGLTRCIFLVMLFFLQPIISPYFGCILLPLKPLKQPLHRISSSQRHITPSVQLVRHVTGLKAENTGFSLLLRHIFTFMRAGLASDDPLTALTQLIFCPLSLSDSFLTLC